MAEDVTPMIDSRLQETTYEEIEVDNTNRYGKSKFVAYIHWV